MTGIQFVTDEQGHKTAVLIDLKKHGQVWEDFYEGLVTESRRGEKDIPYEEYRANRLKRTPPVAKYAIILKPSVEKELDHLADALFARIDARILALADNQGQPVASRRARYPIEVSGYYMLAAIPWRHSHGITDGAPWMARRAAPDQRP